MPVTFSDDECGVLLEAVGEYICDLRERKAEYSMEGDTDSAITVEACIFDIQPLYARLLRHDNNE